MSSFTLGQGITSKILWQQLLLRWRTECGRSKNDRFNYIASTMRLFTTQYAHHHKGVLFAACLLVRPWHLKSGRKPFCPGLSTPSYPTSAAGQAEITFRMKLLNPVPHTLAAFIMLNAASAFMYIYGRMSGRRLCRTTFLNWLITDPPESREHRWQTPGRLWRRHRFYFWAALKE